MSDAAELDHIVINVRTEMDQAEPLFSEVGFTQTPRGYHTLGSINHLMMFGTDYLELIGVPAESQSERPDVANSDYGLNGLVFKSNNVDETFEHLKAVGMAGDPPKAFSRPVTLDGKTQDAKFRTVTVRADVFPGRRVYFCEHGTPELVWRPEWQTHANGVTSMREMVVVSAAPAEEAERFARLTKSTTAGDDVNGYAVPLTGKARLSVLSPQAYAQRFGELALPFSGGDAIFGALVLASDNVAAAAELARASAAAQTVTDGLPDAVCLRIGAFDSVLAFVKA